MNTFTEKYDARRAAAEEINRLAKDNGGCITPEQLVAAAKKPESPMHPFFNWDDSDAAHKYRLTQARTLIRACEVVVKVEQIKVPVPRYVRDPNADPGVQGYVAVERIRTQRENAQDVLLREFGRAESQLNRARNLAAYFDMSDEFADIINRMIELRGRIEHVASTSTPVDA